MLQFPATKGNGWDEENKKPQDARYYLTRGRRRIPAAPLTSLNEETDTNRRHFAGDLNHFLNERTKLLQNYNILEAKLKRLQVDFDNLKYYYEDLQGENVEIENENYALKHQLNSIRFHSTSSFRIQKKENNVLQNQSPKGKKMHITFLILAAFGIVRYVLKLSQRN